MRWNSLAGKVLLAVPLSGLWLLLTVGCAQETGTGVQKSKPELKDAPSQSVGKPRTQSVDGPSQKPEAVNPQPSAVKEPEKKPAQKSLILTVKLALMADARLFRYEIDVGQAEQNIILLGKVPSEEDKLSATDVVRRVEGVSSVTNKLEVMKERPEEMAKSHSRVSFRLPDEAITSSIKERFSKSTTLKAADFGVKTEDGIVSLSGSTRFQVIALEAAEAAREIPGVKAVKTDHVRLEGTN